MKYLSIDLEATGLNENDYIIEFAMLPFDTGSKKMSHNLARHFFIKCPPYEQLKEGLDQWVIEHNKELIIKASELGHTLGEFKEELSKYLNSQEIKKYFNLSGNNKIVIFGKSLNAIDLPFLTRDLGWNFMRQYFHHQVLDLSSVVHSLIDLKKLPVDCQTGSGLMQYLNMGEVCHTALEDAKNTALIYLKLLEKFK